MIHWPLSSPGHQRPRYDLCRINKSLYSYRENFTSPRHLGYQKYRKMQVFSCFLNEFRTTRVNKRRPKVHIIHHTSRAQTYSTTPFCKTLQPVTDDTCKWRRTKINHSRFCVLVTIWKWINRWKIIVYIIPTLSFLVARQIVVMTTCAAASADKVGVMITFSHMILVVSSE